MRIRQGRRNGHNLYLQAGDQPDDADIYLGSACAQVIAAMLAELATIGAAHHPAVVLEHVNGILGHLEALKSEIASRPGRPE